MRLARGFTLVDLIVVLAVLGLVVAVALPMLYSKGCGSRKLKDSTQVRAIHQGMTVWAQSGIDDYPMPSRLDQSNATVSEEGSAKNTTANIYSCMVFSGVIGAEVLVSPLEVNPNVQVMEDYEFKHPVSARDPEHAAWDPKFSAGLTGDRPGNASYAHRQPSSGRRAGWCNDFEPLKLALGTRGLEITSVQKNPNGSVTPTLANPKSNTLLFFGKSKSWSGNMAFNDNHVEFLKDWLRPGKPFKRDRTYTAADGKPWPDIWCYDEADDPKAANDYLGIFLKTGAEPKDFKAAWD